MKNNLLLTISVTLLLNYPKLTIAQAPVLGATASFAFFTASGAFTNTGVSTNIIGDIGTNIGALTGFPPGTITGVIHVADAISAQASTDVVPAYTFLNTLTCDTTIGATLGNNQTLKARVICITTAATLNGDLIFDAQGDSNAIFNMKINGALSTSSHSRILLMNSALHKNIYWQINGLVTLGDSSIFKGTVIANGGINLLTKASLTGRGLSTGGAISMNNTLSALPVKFISFTVTGNNENNVLQWCTASEINNAYYLIEHSTDGIIWATIGKVSAAKTSSSIRTYAFIHKRAGDDMSYYRLKQTDSDGKFEYSSSVWIKEGLGAMPELSIYPNPASSMINLSLGNTTEQNFVISIYNGLGENIFYSTNQSTIDVSNLEDGIYSINVTSTTENYNRKLVVKK